jgi:glycogen operon protein
LGATVTPQGTNFSVFSAHATEVQLLLFDDGLDAPASRIIDLDISENRTAHYWHICIKDIKPGQRYGYRMNGPFQPENGHRFNSEKLLLDPYGRAVETWGYRRAAAIEPGDNQTESMKSVVTQVETYDWEDDQPPRRPFDLT